MAEWLRHLTRKPKVRTAVGSNFALDSLVAVRNSSRDRPEPCEGNLVAAAGSCSGLMVKHPWPLLEISFSDFRRLAMLNRNSYLPTYLGVRYMEVPHYEMRQCDKCHIHNGTAMQNTSQAKCFIIPVEYLRFLSDLNNGDIQSKLRMRREARTKAI